MELSELIIFNNRLLTFDDKTGIVFEVLSGKVIPWVILMDKEKGFKAEWATEKDGKLYVGSTGIEWKDKNGKIEYAMTVKRISKTGEVEDLDWTNYYKALKEASGIKSSGLIWHEAVVWSDIHKKWFFLPRFCSKENLSENKEKNPGCNQLMISNETFTDFQFVDVPLKGEYRKIQGFSSFRFIPGSNDTEIIALKTTETDSITNTFIAVFDIFGHKILSNIDTFLDKYEGIEILKKKLKCQTNFKP